MWGSIRVGQGRQSPSVEVEAESSLFLRERGQVSSLGAGGAFYRTALILFQKPRRVKEEIKRRRGGARLGSGKQAAMLKGVETP